MANKDTGTFGIPGISMPGGGGGGSARVDSSFLNRLDRKERQKEIDAENLRRFEIGQARLNEQKAIQAENQMYQRGREAVRDGYAATAHDQANTKFGWAGQNHANAQESHGWAGEQHDANMTGKNISNTSAQMALDAAKKEQAVVEQAPEIANKILTENQGVALDEFNKLDYELKSGAITQAQYEQKADGIGKALGQMQTNGLDFGEVTDKQAYAGKYYRELTKAGMSASQAKIESENLTGNVKDTDAIANGIFEADTKAIDEEAKTIKELEKASQEAGIADSAEMAKKLIEMGGLGGTKLTNSYKGMTQDPATGEIKYVNGSEVSADEIMPAINDIMKKTYEFAE